MNLLSIDIVDSTTVNNGDLLISGALVGGGVIAINTGDQMHQITGKAKEIADLRKAEVEK